MGGPDESFIFNTLNLNKLSLTLNLSKPEAVEIARSLAKISDVVTQNMRPGVLDRLGLGYEDLKAVKPDIIMLSSSAVGSTGPERLYTGYAPTFAAMGGMAYITGRVGGRPAPLMGTIDLRVGSTGAFAVLAALYHRKRTGAGPAHRPLFRRSGQLAHGRRLHGLHDERPRPGARRATATGRWRRTTSIRCQGRRRVGDRLPSAARTSGARFAASSATSG